MTKHEEWLDEAAKLSDGTIAAAQAAVENNQELKDYLNRTGVGNHPQVIRNFAENPHADPADNLGVFAAGWRARGFMPDNKAKGEPDTSSLGSFLMGPQ